MTNYNLKPIIPPSLEAKQKKPEFQDFRASVGRKVQDHESRIEEFEKDADIPHPHKH
jgi:hypothetical protein